MLLSLIFSLPFVAAAPQGNPTATSLPTTPIQTATPILSAASTASVPSQAALPPKQTWCPSDIFCAGALLQTLNVAKLYPDAKTVVDKPTNKSPSLVLSDFAAIPSPPTYGALANFIDTDFRGEGLELESVSLPSFNPDPAVLNALEDNTLKAWCRVVHGYWAQLARETDPSELCDGTACASSLIPLNHTFVVPGGRFREQYYWDTYWIIQGLIQSELYDVAQQTLQNFMDEIERFGFIPNGGRIYYLNRSQPPLFIHMVATYVAATNDTSILGRALPLAETELKWWEDNRTLNVTSPYTSKTYSIARYAVGNTAPRPESYIEDYMAANDPALPALNESERSSLYAELASGAETGWDYSTRWLSIPSAGLRTLNVRSTVPVCLNSILYRAHLHLADLYDQVPSEIQQRSDGGGGNSPASYHRATASELRLAILDLFWDENKLAFYDFNLTSNTRSGIFSVATFYPLWNGIIPDQVTTQNEAFGMFSSLNMVLRRYNGSFPTTFIDSGLQWDAPNAWPPHQYITLAALRALPRNLTSQPLPFPISGQSAFSLVPPGQLGLSEGELPGQPVLLGHGRMRNASGTGASADINIDGTSVVNGGVGMPGEGWADTLARELANRYMSSAFCSWRATGGSIPGVVPRLSDAELNITQSVNGTGYMFEKFSIIDVNSAGRGGEYTVQAGFGWTNGVVLWTAKNYGNVLTNPVCPSLLDSQNAPSSSSSITSGTVKRFQPRALMMVATLVPILFAG